MIESSKSEDYKKVEQYCLKHDIEITEDIYNKALTIYKKSLVTWNGLKKVNKRLTKEEEENELEMFCIKNQTYSREFDSSIWKNMILKDNIYYPLGYQF